MFDETVVSFPYLCTEILGRTSMPIVTLANLVLYICHYIHAWMVVHTLTCDHDLITHVSSIIIVKI